MSNKGVVIENVDCIKFTNGMQIEINGTGGLFIKGNDGRFNVLSISPTGVIGMKSILVLGWDHGNNLENVQL